ncbi:MAG: PAS domain-containing sensor histidine kinase [Pseudomonadota bacterium]|nr:PAS domain-containing sensor histidine kinase [Pseudomonadota bacterium]
MLSSSHLHISTSSHPFALWLKRNLAAILTLLAFASAIATYAVITGSDAPLGMKPRRVLTFLAIDMSLLSLLAGVVGWRIWRLWASLRAGYAGSKLQKRIVVMFSLVTIVPTLIVSVFSAVFFNLGIEAWFNERVETVVGESLAVAEAYLNEHKENIRGDAIAMAGDLNRVVSLAFTHPQEFNDIVNEQSELRLLTESLVFQGDHILAQGPLSFALSFERLPQDMLDRAAKGEVVIITTEDDKVRALVRLDALANTYLLVGRLIDSKVLAHMQHTQGAVHEYETLKSQLAHLEFAFLVVFITLALLLLLAAIWYGMVFAARLTTPVSRLAVAAERVRGGDFSARVADPGSNDEIGSLSRVFNRMTEQLEAQRAGLIDANRQLDQRRRFSEAVLSGVSAGVIATDHNKRITLFNRSAGAILDRIGQPIAAGADIAEALPNLEELLGQAEQMPGEAAQTTLTLARNGRSLTLHVRATVERLDAAVEGFIVTFDDITLLAAAQKSAAWADVARRVAHEIKNPLTPIALSAERLKRKYLKYITEDQENYVKYTDTIARHVADIGRMVEEFVSFARMPAPRFADEDLSAMIRKAMFSAQVGNPAIEYRLEMPHEPVMLHCDERQIMQVLTNLLKNAAEAVEARQVAQPENREPGRIGIALSCHENAVQLVVEDNGMGFPADNIGKMMEPYVTTRAKGTGLGLAIVRKIIEDHKAKINLENVPGGGARVVLSFSQHCDI